jgi:hypothetical protein
MKRAISAVLIISMLSLNLMTAGCDRKGDPAGPAVFIATVLILGLTVGGWFQHDKPEPFPPIKYDMLPRFGEGEFGGSILSPGERDWYRTEMMRPGDTITIWSKSDIGIRAVLVDEFGKCYPSDNHGPGSDFKIKVRAEEITSYYLEVFGQSDRGIGPYTLYWQYGY